jgi:hypothetical protein
MNPSPNGHKVARRVTLASSNAQPSNTTRVSLYLDNTRVDQIEYRGSGQYVLQPCDELTEKMFHNHMIALEAWLADEAVA